MIQPLPKRQFQKNSPLSEDDWRDFFQRGFCIIRGLLETKEIETTRAALNQVLKEAHQLATQKPANFKGGIYHRGGKFVIESNQEKQLEKLHRVCGCGSLDPTLLATSRHPSLLCAFGDILMADQFEQLICQFHAKTPGDNVTFEPHRDIEFRLNGDPQWQDVNRHGSYVVAVIAIDACHSGNGGLYVVPGSHNNVKLTDISPAKDNFSLQWGLHATTPSLAPGDAILMHPYLVHWSSPNNSNKSRFTLLSGVSSIGANHKDYPGDCTNAILTTQRSP
ncbi:phytanoyl-CoA dioxygenase family protein [Candidatus Sororendozoicomonas aggregata]|uniref:phytanoyl-CoA dioxygenase family protein n=1 Tax=Candidatus Sororendozoicomonas aggregata TaxID=3073239 RepID=UPI002ED44E1F